MKVLVVGAGVIGSLNAARLFCGGVDVALLARGERPAAVREHGVVLQDCRTGQRSVTPVPVVDRIEPGSRYDLAVVIVRRGQVASVLPSLAAAPSIPSVLFLNNNLAGSSDMAAALGSERVLTGMVNAGGQRDGVVVRYIYSRRLRLLFGERDGATRVRTRAIAEMFSGAGLPARVVTDVEEYQKTHAAGLPERLGYPIDADLLSGIKDRLDGFTLPPLSDAAGGRDQPPKIAFGTILTGDQYLHCEATRDRLHGDLGGLAIEMEGGAVAQVCEAFNIPWIVIRALSDLAGRDSRFDFMAFVDAVAASSAAIVRRLLPVL